MMLTIRRVINQLFHTSGCEKINNLFVWGWPHLFDRNQALRVVRFNLRSTLLLSSLLSTFLLRFLLFRLFFFLGLLNNCLRTCWLTVRDRFLWGFWRSWFDLWFFSFKFFQWNFLENIFELGSEVREIVKNESSIGTIVLSQSPSDCSIENFHSLIKLFYWQRVSNIA